MDGLKQKQAYDLLMFSTTMAKEQEQIIKAQDRDLEKLTTKSANEMEAFNKAEANEEKKLLKMLKERSHTELTAFQDKKKKERKHAKEELKEELQESGSSKDVVKAKLKDLKDAELAKIAKAEELFVVQLEAKEAEDYKQFKVTKLAQRHALQLKTIEEVGCAEIPLSYHVFCRIDNKCGRLEEMSCYERWTFSCCRIFHIAVSMFEWGLNSLRYMPLHFVGGPVDQIPMPATDSVP